ncbi:PREDICTED: F-box/kelch-repeat protein At3g06240-like [Fragaria vesca subsp. vesca]|uniref:F-box/kelch-repeat protein At3g06240-like n=1 Tax=Fragaria vesca subsp. vesca TaxID=101020 RepID=UPI0002C3713C|nr:PREDICTED: F-box/kelch-repeat protein At3g06240-like [Fragaria vesca subsp. vesca]
MTTFSEMLEEMVVRILSRLPPKSLVRFRCVSKLWNTIINDPSFVAKHLSISRHNKFVSETCILVKHTLFKDRSITNEEQTAAFRKKQFDYSNEDLLLSLLHICNDDDDGDGDNLTFVVEDLDVMFPSSTGPSSLRIIGHCDGIICLNNNVDDVLCNPAIREFKVLPESCVLYDLPPRAEEDDDETAPWSMTAAMGFGLDSKAKEYKVVRVVETTSGLCTYHPTRAEIYTIGANSWRELENVDIAIGCHPSWAPSFVLHFKGICYWWAFAAGDKEVILTFDMSDEQFHPIPVPDCFDFYNDRCYRSTAVLKDFIVLLTYETGDEVPKSFNIWMMDESTGVKGSWIKYLAFGPVEGIQIPLVFWNTEELLMVSSDSRVVSYNIGTKRLHRFPIQGVEGALHLQAVNYVNNVISVKGDCKHESSHR